MSPPAASPPAAASRKKPGEGRPGAGKLRNDLRTFARNRLIEAALRSFQEQGYRETTVERIAELAGTTPPTFYRYFTSKEELLVPLQIHLSAKTQDFLGKMTPADVESPDAMAEWIGRYLSLWDDLRRLIKAFWDAAPLDRPFDRETYLRMLTTSGTVARLRPDLPAADHDRYERRLGSFLLLLDRLAFVVRLAPDDDLRRDLIADFAQAIWIAVFAPR